METIRRFLKTEKQSFICSGRAMEKKYLSATQIGMFLRCGRLANVSERVAFLVEKVDKGIKVAIKGREAETEEVIPFAKLKESVTRAA